jgi:hypothetical protein
MVPYIDEYKEIGRGPGGPERIFLWYCILYSTFIGLHNSTTPIDNPLSESKVRSWRHTSSSRQNALLECQVDTPLQIDGASRIRYSFFKRVSVFLNVYQSAGLPHICVLILPYMCPHITKYV